MTPVPPDDPPPRDTFRGDRAAPRFGDPLSWSVPILRLGDTMVRVHAVLLATIVVILVRAGWFAGDLSFFLGPVPAGIFLGGLFMVVFIHETATLIALRFLGGDLPEIVLQPLGGLEQGVPPSGWKKSLIAAMVGPSVTAMAAGLAMIAIYLDSGTVPMPDPFTFSGVYSPGVAESIWLESLYLFAIAATLVSVANLLPVTPFRGQLILGAILRPRLGRAASHRATHRVGIATAILLSLAGLFTLHIVPILIALLSAAMLQRTHQRLREVDKIVGGDDSQVVDIRLDAILDQQDAAEQDAADARAASERSKGRAMEEAALNRILEKIAQQGMSALDSNERRVLDAATKRRRADSSEEDSTPSA